ncbi:MAG: LacI family DNA-binding transcriptional regulator [Thermoflexales bacterium]|nr:LacI family DNA-binding transcriptional regulator [Thermoflexales bacterium]
MANVAEQSGVSLATVSLVLRGKPGISSGTRQRVLEVAKGLGYIPTSVTIPSKSTVANIGLILKADLGPASPSNQFYSHVVSGIEMVCRQRQLNLLYATMTVDEDNYPLDWPRVLVKENTSDGLLFVGAFLNGTLLQVTDHHSVPIVLVDAYARPDTYDVIVSDNITGAYQAITHLIQHGHRHIGLVGCHPKAYPSIQERYDGYVRALEDHHISERYVAKCNIVNTHQITEATSALLRQNPHITAIFGVNDEVALAVMDVARSLGRRLPDELSVVGFDNIDLAACVSPALTTMHIDKVGMGRLAVQLLINRIEHPDSGLVRVTVRPHLVERASVCATSFKGGN